MCLRNIDDARGVDGARVPLGVAHMLIQIQKPRAMTPL